MTNSNLFYHALVIEIEDYSGKYEAYVKYVPKLFDLLNKLSENSDIDDDSKLIINSALSYLIITNDVIPDNKEDGYLDDLYAISYCLEILIKNGYKNKIKEMWKYDGNILELNREVYEKSAEVLNDDQKVAVLKLAGLRNYRKESLNLDKKPFHENHYEFAPQKINDDKWNSRESRLRNSFVIKIKDLYGSSKIDSKGISLPMDLTISSSGSTNDYRIVCDSWGDKNIFHFLCPEFESYMTFINWIHNDKREEEFGIFDNFMNKNDPNHSLKIRNNYRMSKDYFSLIIQFKSEISPEPLSQPIMWSRVPFLKMSGEVIGSLPSPSFMSRLYSDMKNVNEEKVRFFTSAFQVLSKKENFAKIKIFQNTSSHCMIADIKLDDPIINFLSSGKTYVGLFEEAIYRDGGYQRRFTLKNISHEDDAKEILGHFILQRLYYNYLKNTNEEDIVFQICTLNDLKKHYLFTLKKVRKIFGDEFNYDFEDYFVPEFLTGFFRIINDKVYYSPYILKDYNDEEFLTLSKVLHQKSLDSLGIPFVEKYKYADMAKKLRLVNHYNMLGKESIIRILKSNKHIQESKPWKWRI
ncbi:MAG: YkvA family protein [Bacteroidales bacterium]|jgi:uncharacterized membrane protein YkvA (DUF1232 family)|nr:YkvA family protein [Bacteroidales bacterium]